MPLTASQVCPPGAPDNDDHIKNMKNPEANKYCPNDNPVLKFAGYDWWINYHWSQQTGTYADEPFKSIFDPKIIGNSSGGVTLRIEKPTSEQPDTWRTSELVLTNRADYGRRLLTARADGGSFSKLDPKAVFGFYLYQYSCIPGPNDLDHNMHREIDFLEVLNAPNGQFTLQPWDHNPHPWKQFRLPDECPVITVVNDWFYNKNALHVSCEFYLFIGDYSLSNLPPLKSAHASWMPYPEHDFWKLVPERTDASCARVHINLWLMHGEAPSAPQSVTVTRYQYQEIKQ